MDIWEVVSEFIPKGSWKSFIFTCKYFYSFNNLNEVRHRSNHLLTLIKMYPDKDWCWQSISYNSSVPYEFIKNNLDKPFCLIIDQRRNI